MKHTGTHTKTGFFLLHIVFLLVCCWGFSLLMMGWIIPNGIAEGYDGGVISPTTVPMLFSALIRATSMCTVVTTSP